MTWVVRAPPAGSASRAALLTPPRGPSLLAGCTKYRSCAGEPWPNHSPSPAKGCCHSCFCDGCLRIWLGLAAWRGLTEISPAQATRTEPVQKKLIWKMRNPAVVMRPRSLRPVHTCSPRRLVQSVKPRLSSPCRFCISSPAPDLFLFPGPRADAFASLGRFSTLVSLGPRCCQTIYPASVAWLSFIFTLLTLASYTFGHTRHW